MSRGSPPAGHTSIALPKHGASHPTRADALYLVRTSAWKRVAILQLLFNQPIVSATIKRGCSPPNRPMVTIPSMDAPSASMARQVDTQTGAGGFAMRRKRSSRALASGLALAVLTVGAAGADVPAVGRFEEEIQPILVDYCYGCHADGMKKGGVAFDELPLDGGLAAKRDLWWAVLKNVRAG